VKYLSPEEAHRRVLLYQLVSGEITVIFSRGETGLSVADHDFLMQAVITRAQREAFRVEQKAQEYQHFTEVDK
jgi:hypothetical protein